MKHEHNQLRRHVQLILPDDIADVIFRKTEGETGQQ